MRSAYAQLAIILIALVLLPASANACTVCFGALDDPQMNSALMGVGVLLGFVAVVLSSFALFALHLVRRSRMVAHAQKVEVY